MTKAFEVRLALAAVIGVAAVGAWGVVRVVRHAARRVVASAPAPAAPHEMREWLFAYGRINDDSVRPLGPRHEIIAPSRDWIVVHNPNGAAARCTLTFFFEQRPPLDVVRDVPAFETYALSVEGMREVPRGEVYGVRVRSTLPVVTQETYGEYEAWDPVTHAEGSRVGYPGPLGANESRWSYADGLVIATDGPLEEREWITVLNPSPGDSVTLRILFRQDGSDHVVTRRVGPERVGYLALSDFEGFAPNRLSGFTIESSRPVLVEQIRRSYERGVPVIKSLWVTRALPVGTARWPAPLAGGH